MRQGWMGELKLAVNTNVMRPVLCLRLPPPLYVPTSPPTAAEQVDQVKLDRYS